MSDSNLAAQYVGAYLDAADALQAGMAAADTDANDLGLALGDRLLARAAADDLEREIALLSLAHEAFMAKFGGLNGPSEKIVDKAIQLSTALAQNIASNKKAVAILQIVTAFVDSWNSLSAGSDGAGTTGGAAPTAATSMPALATASRKRISTSAWLQHHFARSNG